MAISDMLFDWREARGPEPKEDVCPCYGEHRWTVMNTPVSDRSRFPTTTVTCPCGAQKTEAKW